MELLRRKLEFNVFVQTLTNGITRKLKYNVLGKYVIKLKLNCHNTLDFKANPSDK